MVERQDTELAWAQGACVGGELALPAVAEAHSQACLNPALSSPQHGARQAKMERPRKTEVSHLTAACQGQEGIPGQAPAHFPLAQG